MSQKVATGADRREDLDRVFKALASGQRREILRILSERGDDGCYPTEVCACELTKELGLAPSTISHHMRQLIAVGLVHPQRRGLWVYYTLDREILARTAHTIESL